ncbi:MAG: molybdopterin-dependent oxidoreductase [Deltaproteobacteria bacterium]|nr:molybdopterin-dependent oxidoreductase [Deltaproteobacteria bacterium]
MKRESTRRGFLKRIGVGALGLGFGVSVFEGIYQFAEALTDEEAHALLRKGTVNFMGFMAQEITPNEEFYITNYSSTIPNVDADTFQLRIEGLVEKPYTLTMKDLQTMRDKLDFVTLQCIGNPLGGDAIGNALWEGVTLRKIIEKAMPKRGLVKTVFFAEDGYSDSIPYPLSLSEDVFLAFKMNGKDLPKIHGYPLRVIVPGIYGMKNVKWLSKIELVNFDFKGYWEKKGWSDEAIIPVKSQILMPMEGKKIPFGHYVIGGLAYGGRYGISKVQVSLDGGKKWEDADIKKPLSKWAWTLWSYQWKPLKENRYTIKVRGFDRSGKVQESGPLKGHLFRSGSFPDGAKGIHSVGVTAQKT